MKVTIMKDGVKVIDKKGNERKKGDKVDIPKSQFDSHLNTGIFMRVNVKPESVMKK